MRHFSHSQSTRGLADSICSNYLQASLCSPPEKPSNAFQAERENLKCNLRNSVLRAKKLRTLTVTAPDKPLKAGHTQDRGRETHGEGQQHAIHPKSSFSLHRWPAPHSNTNTNQVQAGRQHMEGSPVQRTSRSSAS